MAQFDDEIATALELIEENGEKVDWVQETETAANTDEPWKDGETSSRTYKPFICFVPTSDTQWRKLLAYLKGTEVPSGRLAGLMGNVKFEPRLKDRITRQDGTVLSISNVDLLSPNGQKILYTLEFIK